MRGITWAKRRKCYEWALPAPSWAPVTKRIAPVRYGTGHNRTNHPLSHNRPPRLNVDMDVRDSFSRLKKKLKHPLTGNRRKTGRTEAGADVERVDPTNSLPRLKPGVVDRDREGGGANEDGQQVRLAGRPSQLDEPEPVPTHGSENGQGEGEGEGFSQEHSHPHSHVEVAVESGHGGEGDDDSGESRASLSLPAHSFDSARRGTRQYVNKVISAAASDHIPDGVDTPTVPDGLLEVSCPNEGAEPCIAMDENKSSWKSTASGATKLLLRGVRDSADAFGPLKAVAGGLCFILENCEVWIPFHIYYPQRSKPEVPQRTKGNNEAIELLAPRVKALAGLLCTPVSEGDIKGESRRKTLER